MTPHRDPDRLIRTYLFEGAERLNDQVYDAVRAEIDHKRQRVIIGPWRMPNMNKLVPIGLGAIAVVVALVVAVPLLSPSASGGVGGAPTASPSPTAQPSVASPSPAPQGLLLPGAVHRLSGGPVAMNVTIPATDWYGDPGQDILVKDENADPPAGAGLITFAGDLYVYGDPCRWATTKPDAPATTVDELVAALTAQASRDASAPVDITLDGYAGKSITLHVPKDVVISECDTGYFASWGVPGDEPSRYHQGPGQIDKLWILDVNGVLTVIDTAYYDATPPDVVNELDAIVESTTFE
jgi:hypothetical protein